ncbi:MAG: DUF3568 family protein [Gemmatimonadetes bacterium]|nr:DUF3568 family protein [Gemmatimonadota bacterium]
MRFCLLALVLSLLPLASACAAAVGAAAGSAAAIALDERNASSEVAASVSQLTQATESAFAAMNIVVNNRSMATDGSTAQLRGIHEGANATVDITRSGDNTSRVVVNAREGELVYREPGRPHPAADSRSRVVEAASSRGARPLST